MDKQPKQPPELPQAPEPPIVSEYDRNLLTALADVIEQMPGMYERQILANSAASFCRYRPLGIQAWKAETVYGMPDPLIEEMNLCLLALGRAVESHGMVIKRFTGFDPQQKMLKMELVNGHNGQSAGILGAPAEALAKSLKLI